MVCLLNKREMRWYISPTKTWLSARLADSCSITRRVTTTTICTPPAPLHEVISLNTSYSGHIRGNKVTRIRQISHAQIHSGATFPSFYQIGSSHVRRPRKMARSTHTTTSTTTDDDFFFFFSLSLTPDAIREELKEKKENGIQKCLLVKKRERCNNKKKKKKILRVSMATSSLARCQERERADGISWAWEDGSFWLCRAWLCQQTVDLALSAKFLLSFLDYAVRVSRGSSGGRVLRVSRPYLDKCEII